METKKLLLSAAVLGLTLTVHAAENKASNALKDEVKGQCYEVNKCRGTSDCHSQANTCAGANTCKGKGWLKMTEKECKNLKGKYKAQ